MSEKREEIRSNNLMLKLDEKVNSLYRIDTRNDLSTVLEADDLIEGATAVLWMIINMILSTLDYPPSNDIL